MDRKNILLNRRPMMSFSNQNQSNSSHLSHFLSATKTKGSVSKCLFGRPDEGDTQRLQTQMQHQERIRAINLYHFDIVAGQPVNLTPPASPYIGNQRLPAASDRVQHEQLQDRPSNSERVNALERNEEIAIGDENQNEIVIVKCESSSPTCHGINRESLKRRSSEQNEGEEEFRMQLRNNGKNSMP